MNAIEEVEVWKRGFTDGQEFIFEFLKENTKLEFKSAADIVIWIRNHQGAQNEVK
jgi:hypothetical protein